MVEAVATAHVGGYPSKSRCLLGATHCQWGTRMDVDRTVPRATIAEMVEFVDPSVTLLEAELATAGHLPVYHLVVETEAGKGEWVVKATPEDASSGVATEARLLAIVDEHTSIPVPRVVGVVDDHESLPAPYLVMERAPGENLPKRAIGELSDDALAHIAYESGGYLAALHALDGPSGYGLVTVDTPTTYAGGRPSTSLDQLAITDLQGVSSSDQSAWPEVFRTWCDDTLDRHASTRFGDLTGQIRPVVDTLVDELDGPYTSVIARVDHGLHNILVEPDNGRITGVIDWAFTLSVPPAYDLACVEANLALGPWSMHPSTPDRRWLVQENLYEGYRVEARSEGDGQIDRNRSVYMLIAVLRAMNHLDAMPEFVMAGATEAEVDASAQAYRQLVSTWLS